MRCRDMRLSPGVVVVRWWGWNPPTPVPSPGQPRQTHPQGYSCSRWPAPRQTGRQLGGAARLCQVLL